MNCIECGNPKVHVKKYQLCQTCNSRKWRRENPDKYLIGRTRWYEENKEKEIAKAIAWNKANPAAYKKNRAKWSKESNYTMNRYNSDLNFKLKVILRNRLLQSVKTDAKAGSAVSDLGCSIEDFKKYLEAKFIIGMTWDNIGQWHLDHVVPLASFDLTDRAQFLKACHYSNMQPLWKEDNLKKSDSV